MWRCISTVCCLLTFICTSSAAEALRPVGLKCDYRANPLGVDLPQPGLSWVVESADASARGIRQAAYQIRVASSPALLEQDHSDLWDSGKVASDQMAHIPYAGQALVSHQRCWWTVRVWNQDGQASAFTEAAAWTMGVLTDTAWQARWISAPSGGDKSGPLPLFRRDVSLAKPLKRALVSICGLGFYELSLNGTRVGDQVIDPGWTDYRKRCLYSTYDVTDRFRSGASGVTNTLGVMLGNGMYNVRGGRYVKFLGSFGPPRFILQLHVEFEDGTSTNLVSDASWKTAPGPVTFSCMYGGEDYDARREQPGWDAPGFDASAWAATRIVDGPGGRLVAQSAPPVKVMATFPPAKVTEPKPSVFVYDLGQNLSGWPELAVRGPAGSTVKLIPGELVDNQGLVSQGSSGGPVSFNYTLRGAGAEERWHPRFSYYGFRFMQLEGAVPADRVASTESDEKTVVIDLRSQFIRSSGRVVGEFASSDTLLNRTHQLILRAIESNLQSVLTDCPHREKLGWLEVSHLLGPAIMFNYDVPLLYRKICDDMADAQLENGLVPDIAPEFTVFSGGFRDSPEWGSASVVNPWLIYQRYGDPRPLAAQYDVMSRYVGYLGSKASAHILSHGLGDWYDIGPKSPGESQLTSKGVTATAIYYHDVDLVRRTAEVLGRSGDAARWTALAADISRAFNARFFDAGSGRYDRGSQTAQAMPLVLGLVPPDRAADVLANLVRDVRARTNQVTAGDVGFRFLVEALRQGGRSDVLFDMVTRVDGPGYADQLRKGATTLTEAWDAGPASSQNHCMLGHAEEWFYTGLAGINPDPEAPGFRRISLQPQVVGNLTSVRARYDSMSGPIESAWTRSGQRVTYEISVPPNTSATLRISTADAGAVTESGKPVADVTAVRLQSSAPGVATYELGSGRYVFAAPVP